MADHPVVGQRVSGIVFPYRSFIGYHGLGLFRQQAI